MLTAALRNKMLYKSGYEQYRGSGGLLTAANKHLKTIHNLTFQQKFHKNIYIASVSPVFQMCYPIKIL